LPIVPRISGIDLDYVISAEDALLGNKFVGENVVVIGGGSVGLETAELLVDQGKNVTVIEMLEEILADMSPVLKGGLLNRISKSPIKVFTCEKVMEIKDHVVITDKQTIDKVDTIILSVGYKANNSLITQLQESNVDFKVIGDAIKPRKIYNAIKEGFEIAYNL